MLARIRQAAEWLLGPEAPSEGPRTHLLPRWIFLRALGLIYFSAFYSLVFQIKGLIGPRGILPAGEFLGDVAAYYPGLQRFWFAPTLLWFGSGNHALMLVCWLGLVASVAVILNLWPRGALAVCLVCFLSFVAAAQDFSGYQSDGMLLEAGFISLFFAPPGLRPGLGAAYAPSRLSLFLLRWEWFRIYFESGIVKLASGDPQWRNFTAMDHYYENGPLPTWLGWYAQHLPHAFHVFCVLLTLAVELALVWMAWLPRPFRLICFAMATTLQAIIIATANYAFLNHLVLILGFLLLDDRALARLRLPTPAPVTPRPVARWRRWGALALAAWIVYASVVSFYPLSGLPRFPSRVLRPFRVGDRYGLFAVMTTARYEIELQGTRDGVHWVAYPFRYKPQDPLERPGIYAPYQPRFEWNLWFASLDSWQGYTWVLRAQARLLDADPGVLQLFRADPFHGARPQAVRAVRWQYWFSDPATKRATGAWWRREELGLYSPTLERGADGTIGLGEEP
jgi:lipase maturation factor